MSKSSVDEREKSRKLTPAEQRRIKNLEKLTEEMTAKGYTRVDLTVGIVKANIFALALMIPLLVVGVGLYVLYNREFGRMPQGFGPFVIFMMVLLVLVVVHELIHGITWSFFTPNHFKDIEFGFMKEYLTPYCTCNVTLSKWHHLCGTLMPLILLGIVPMVIGILTGNFGMLLMGVVMADAAGGDIMIAWKILTHKSNAKESVYIDHPTQAGIVVFER